MFLSGKSVECSLGMACKYFFESFVTIPVAAFITDLTTHFLSHVRCFCIIIIIIIIIIMARPRVANGGTASNMEGSCE